MNEPDKYFTEEILNKIDEYAKTEFMYGEYNYGINSDTNRGE